MHSLRRVWLHRWRDKPRAIAIVDYMDLIRASVFSYEFKKSGIFLRRARHQPALFQCVLPSLNMAHVRFIKFLLLLLKHG